MYNCIFDSSLGLLESDFTLRHTEYLIHSTEASEPKHGNTKAESTATCSDGGNCSAQDNCSAQEDCSAQENWSYQEDWSSQKDCSNEESRSDQEDSSARGTRGAQGSVLEIFSGRAETSGRNSLEASSPGSRRRMRGLRSDGAGTIQ